MLEMFDLKQKYHQTRVELSNALYESDAAKRVIARLIRERDEARDQLANIKVVPAVAVAPQKSPKKASPKKTEAMEVDEAPNGASLPQEIVAAIDAKGRRKRKALETVAPANQISQFTAVSSFAASKSGIQCLDVSTESKGLVLSGNKKGNVSVYDPTDSSVKFDTKAHTGGVHSVAWVQGTDKFVSCGEDGSIGVWAHADGAWTESVKAKPHSGPVVAVSVHPTGKLIVSASTDASWSILDISNGKVLAHVPVENAKGGFTTCQIHPDGILLGLGGADGKVRIFDLRTMALVHVFEGHEQGAVSGLVFSENGYYLASSTDSEKLIRIWDLRKLSNIHNIPVDAPVSVLTWDLSGQYLAANSGSDIRYNYVISYESVYLNKQWTQLLSVHVEKAVGGLVFGQDAKQLLVGSSNGKISILSTNESE